MSNNDSILKLLTVCGYMVEFESGESEPDNDGDSENENEDDNENEYLEESDGGYFWSGNGLSGSRLFETEVEAISECLQSFDPTDHELTEDKIEELESFND